MMVGGRETQLLRQTLMDIVTEVANTNQEADAAKSERLVMEFISTLDKLLLCAMLDEARNWRSR